MLTFPTPLQRSKLHHNKPPQPDMSAVSPTLTPALPEPLPPTNNGNQPNEEIAFFDRVKKFIGNKQTMNEFLKLCNLFSQDLIDKNILVSKASSFIGGNNDLYSWFKRWVGYDGRDEIIENKTKASNGKVILSNCRGLGPSYRLLPKRVSVSWPMSSLSQLLPTPTCECTRITITRLCFSRRDPPKLHFES
jgi:paired amphipathic helix protein Sin3a